MEFLKQLYSKTFGVAPDYWEALPASGSARQYFRLSAPKQKPAIAVYNPNSTENATFVAYSQHFLKHKLNVPLIYAVDEANNGYLQQDLGNVSLLDYVLSRPQPENLKNAYQKALSKLAFMQLYAGVDLDFSVSGAYQHFDKEVMGWDLNYFKYWLLLPSRIAFDEYKLAIDFNQLLRQLEAANQAYFLYRDFQARNVMIYAQELYFIDYQGAKQGALQYDVASLLYQAKADLSDTMREELLSYYLGEVGQYIRVEELEFRQQYDRYVLLRLLQVLGSYGYRGFYEQKPHFLSSLPYGLENLKNLQQKKSYLFAQLPELSRVIGLLVDKYGKIN